MKILLSFVEEQEIKGYSFIPQTLAYLNFCEEFLQSLYCLSLSHYLMTGMATDGFVTVASSSRHIWVTVLIWV